ISVPPLMPTSVICILSTVTTSSSATNPSSSAGATAMPVTQTAKKPSKPVKKNHACEMCGKAFRDVYHLNRHKLSHSDEKPFECPICNQRFKRKDRMTYHVRSHEGGITKPYTCGVCGKGFSRPDHLSCHVKHVHSTERPFKCQTCTAAFATKDRLRTHMVRHEGKVSCNICGKLLSAAYITSHLKTHGQSQSINCNTYFECLIQSLVQSPLKFVEGIPLISAGLNGCFSVLGMLQLITKHTY
uniref:C2H2-type domain-containing protein n=1 Tax=Anolis carolinensis TaxID=28377 RepID=A0A803T7F7_ANOCA